MNTNFTGTSGEHWIYGHIFKAKQFRSKTTSRFTHLSCRECGLDDTGWYTKWALLYSGSYLIWTHKAIYTFVVAGTVGGIFFEESAG